MKKYHNTEELHNWKQKKNAEDIPFIDWLEWKISCLFSPTSNRWTNVLLIAATIAVYSCNGVAMFCNSSASVHNKSLSLSSLRDIFFDLFIGVGGTSETIIELSSSCESLCKRGELQRSQPCLHNMRNSVLDSMLQRQVQLMHPQEQREQQPQTEHVLTLQSQDISGI